MVQQSGWRPKPNKYHPGPEATLNTSPRRGQKDDLSRYKINDSQPTASYGLDMNNVTGWIRGADSHVQSCSFATFQGCQPQALIIRFRGMSLGEQACGANALAS